MVALVVGVGVVVLYEQHAMGLGLRAPVPGAPDATTTLDGWEAGKLYLTAYLVEWALSMDNVFVMAMIFTSLGIPLAHQHRVLFWGILGSLGMRGLIVGVGAGLLAHASWVIYVCS